MKAGKLAEILLRTPEAKVYVQVDDNENGCLVNGVRKLVDNDNKARHIIMLSGSSSETVFVPDLDTHVVKRQPTFVVKSKSGKIL
jgi:hypothetical protein